MESSILDWIQTNLRTPVLDLLMPAITALGNGGLIWIVLAAGLLLMPGHRKAGAAVLAGLALEVVCCNLVLKPLIGRIRPFAVNPDVVLLIAPPGDASFPSGHTAVSFAAVFALKTAGSPLWKPALALAVVIAFSRLYLYVHWPSDVLGGAILGAAVGWAGAKLAAAIAKRGKSRT